MNANAIIVDIECIGIENAADYLEPVEAPVNYKDPQKIADFIAEGTAKAIERCGLDPDLCRIVALGCGNVDGDDVVMLCKTEQQEASALRSFWGRVVNVAGATRTLISFNGFGYDLPVLMRRSQYLGVDCPMLNIDRYRSPHIDLMQTLTFRGAVKPHKLKFYASRFGMPVADDVDGGQISELVKAGDWSAVEQHCLSDLQITRFLAQKLKLIPTPQPAEAF